MIAKGDWVTSHHAPGIGLVQRVSKKRGWADVQWGFTQRVSDGVKIGKKTKRMSLVDLCVITIIDVHPTEVALKRASQC